MNRLLLRLLLGLAVLLPLGGLGLQRHLPALPHPLELTLTLPAGQPGQTVPLVVTGDTGAGDLLYAHYTEPTTVVFGYDSWAVGGPASAPVTLAPGIASPFTVTLPSLPAPPRVDRRAEGTLRVAYGGREVLQGRVHYHGRQSHEVYFGENPIGGTITNHRFNGEIRTTDGRRLTGRPTTLFPWTQRLGAWLQQNPFSFAALLLISFITAFGGSALLRRVQQFLGCPRPLPPVTLRTRSTHTTFALTALVCTGWFGALVTGGTFQFVAAESFGQFYDHQAVSLLQGRLDVPEAALGSESFVFAGKYYGYFGPTPALLRMPFVLAGVGFGQLSRVSMVLAYVLCLAAAYTLLLQATRRLTGGRGWPARQEVALLIGGAGAGSTLFFLGSRAYIYHEAILWGVAFALWGAWAVLRWLEEPARHRWWVLALLCGLASVHARPPTGLFTLGVLGCAAAWRVLVGLRWVRDGECAAPSAPGVLAPSPAGVLLPLTVGALAVLGVLSFNGLSYLKFRSFDGAPLRYHVQYHPERLAVIEGRNFHVGNLPYGFANYLWAPNVTVRPTFPYVYLRGIDPRDFPGSRIDLAENTLALPYTMPALVWLALIGAAVALWRWTDARLPLAVLAAGTVPMAFALFAAVAVSQRYTADFTPALLTAAAFGVAGLATLPAGVRRPLLVGAVALTVVAVGCNTAFALHYQGEGVWGVPDDVKARYLVLRQTMDSLLGFSRL